ncbi:hypothetical protein FGO68_gene14838 [Halteria grandinella]|uniref:Uncharacterized protein n=1 Tax=Halteria grandinella TaxID=5974 RepID=A0A8J8NGE5_HALGN|nr:hypothetical protein FGO68_gene14838 [Halteria grandinella]
MLPLRCQGRCCRCGSDALNSNIKQTSQFLTIKVQDTIRMGREIYDSLVILKIKRLPPYRDGINRLICSYIRL